MDSDLKNTLKDAQQMCGSQVQRLKKFMEQEGVTLPPLSETKPNSNSIDIPQGVKMTDDEIANAISLKTVGAMVACTTTIAQSIRTDVGMMFTQFLSEQMIFGSNLKALLRKRGWLKVPPYYIPPGLPNK